MFGKDRESLVSAKLEEKGATRPCSRSFGSTEIRMNSYHYLVETLACGGAGELGGINLLAFRQ
jgi:hypothetical protein